MYNISQLHKQPTFKRCTYSPVSTIVGNNQLNHEDVIIGSEDQLKTNDDTEPNRNLTKLKQSKS